ncbi:E3 ubiquitin-protein ligase TRIM39-like [Megalops cyprinoides]|uniref:E3 ubiquitin-protein ligase TRIM39-like n=1 Tax=Megalops cyprinoides TaxID=118141 RepID=UPI001863FAA2|nr:E3 ubiquitin-protein ligase TRIM39-like [Megalops cyprinoides]XP_036404797.1 E3 ubiquitin-protein ligase TRIM39-like [Megalops cyprinoides]
MGTCFSKEESKREQIEELKKENVTLRQELKKLHNEFGGENYVLKDDFAEIKKMTAQVTLPAMPKNSSIKTIVGKRVRFIGDVDDVTEEWPGVLGEQEFHTGRHYWEVEVGEKQSWRIGVSSKPVAHGEANREMLGESYWMLQLQDEQLSARSAEGEINLQNEKPWKIGVHLDIDKKNISFYNTETKTQIHSFSLTGQRTIGFGFYPYLSPGSKDRDLLAILT